MKNKGFTLVELLIAMLIMSIIVALTFPVFRDVLTASKGESASEEAQIDKIISLELLRLDLEHATFGIALDEANPPLTLALDVNGNQILQLNGTLNNTNQATLGWMIYNCSGGGALAGNEATDMRQDPTNNNIVLLDSDKNFAAVTTTTAGVCPPVLDIYTAFPYDIGGVNVCATQFCTDVRYQLSLGPSPLTTCAAGTRNLLRAVGAAAGSPVLNCVADFTVRFDLDTTGDGRVDTPQAVAPPATTAQILTQVKNIDMFVLMQEGRRDENLNTNANLNIDVPLSLATVTEDPTKFRWKVVRISGKPMSR